jgi:hypothetical protein
MPPIEVHEYDGGQIDGERQNAEDRKKEEDVAVGDDHRPPVGALELLDQEAGGGHERHTEDEIGDGNEDTRKRHGLPHISPALQTHADYLRLPTLRLEPDRFSPTLHFGAGDSI